MHVPCVNEIYHGHQVSMLKMLWETWESSSELNIRIYFYLY